MRAILAVLLGLVLGSPAIAQSLVNGQQPVTIVGAPQQMPFVRVGDAFAFPVTTTAQTYAIVQPDGTASYRGVNQCSADVAIKSVAPSKSVSTQPVYYGGQVVPNVLLVTTTGENVSALTGTVFLGRTAETLGSSPNPVSGSTRYVSIIALADPGSPCLFRLGYGNGG